MHIKIPLNENGLPITPASDVANFVIKLRNNLPDLKILTTPLNLVLNKKMLYIQRNEKLPHQLSKKFIYMIVEFLKEYEFTYAEQHDDIAIEENELIVFDAINCSDEEIGYLVNKYK
jgi:hypothetical protein